MMKIIKKYLWNKLIFANPLPGKQIYMIPGVQHNDAGEEFRMIDEKLYKELLIRSEYVSLFKQYVNDDWDRNNPFKEIIETEQKILFSRSKHKLVYPLKSKISELPLTDKEIDHLKNVFKTDYDIVKEIPLGKYLMNISWLKSYSESQETKSPEVFYEWVFQINN